MNKRIRKKCIKKAFYMHTMTKKLYESEDMDIIFSNQNIGKGMSLTKEQWDDFKKHMKFHFEHQYLRPYESIIEFLYKKDVKSSYWFFNSDIRSYLNYNPPKISSNHYTQFRRWYAKLVYVNASLRYRARQLPIKTVPSPSLIDHVLKTEDYQKALKENTLKEFYDSITDWRYKYL